MPFLIVVNHEVSGTKGIDVLSCATYPKAVSTAELRFLSGPSFSKAMFAPGSDFILDITTELSASAADTELVYNESDDLEAWTNRLGEPG